MTFSRRRCQVRGARPVHPTVVRTLVRLRHRACLPGTRPWTTRSPPHCSNAPSCSASTSPPSRGRPPTCWALCSGRRDQGLEPDAARATPAARRLWSGPRRLHRPPATTGHRGAAPVTDEAGHCSFCGTTSGPFAKVEGLFTVLICIPCLEVRLARRDTLPGFHDPGQPSEKWGIRSRAVAAGSLDRGISRGTPQPSIPAGPLPTSCCGRIRTSASGSCTAVAHSRRT